jgi:hypothetical protein
VEKEMESGKRSLEGSHEIPVAKRHKKNICSHSRYLNTLNRHDRDQYVQFEPLAHKYSVDWETTGRFSADHVMSVTGLYKCFFPAFDADSLICMMRRGPNFDRSKYACMTNDDIKAVWNTARDRGTFIHDQIECYYNQEKDIDELPECDEIDQFREFVKSTGGVTPYWSEHYVYTDARTKIAGAIDMVYVNQAYMDLLWSKGTPTTLHVQIYDWKVCKNMGKWSKETGYYPLEDVKNAKFWHYSIQLNMYQYIVETYYKDPIFRGHRYANICVDSCFLCVMHESRKKFSVQPVPNFQSQVAIMMDLRAQNLDLIEKNEPQISPFVKEELNFDVY